MADDDPFKSRADAWGAPTDWSLVAGASAMRSGPEAEQRWHDLLERYRHPVRLAVRRKMRGNESADDVVDAFFTYLYTGNVLAKVDRERGRFRCFLQVVLRRYISRERMKTYRDRSVPLEGEVPVRETPEIEAQEEAEWAETVLKNAIAELQRENERGAAILLRLHGIPPYPETSTEALCAEYDLKANALYQAAFRARRRLRDLVLEEIRKTVETVQDYEVEKKVIIARLLDAYSHVFADPSG